MDCKNIYCIFNSSNKCLLDSITINQSGICSDFIQVSFPNNEYEKLKEKFYGNLHNHWTKNKKF